MEAFFGLRDDKMRMRNVLSGQWLLAVAMLWGGTAHAQTALEMPAPLAGGQERIIHHIGYTVSYNGDRRLPNWVAYELTPEETSGPAARQNRFVPDPEVPPHETATTDDYRHSGYDRGHMAPAGDMKWSEQAMRESFYLSNICPQHPALNRGIWKQLEDLVRKRAATRGSVYVVCGPIAAEDAPRIGRQGVVVPQRFFKALLQEAEGRWSAIGFVFENEASDADLWVHTLSIDSLERLTGMDFFPHLPDSIETAVERETDLSWWGL